MEIKGENALTLLLGTGPGSSIGNTAGGAITCLHVDHGERCHFHFHSRQFILSGSAMIFSGYGTAGVEFRVTAGNRQHIANPRSALTKEKERWRPR